MQDDLGGVGAVGFAWFRSLWFGRAVGSEGGAGARMGFRTTHANPFGYYFHNKGSMRQVACFHRDIWGLFQCDYI